MVTVKPLNTKLANNFEIFNEVCILIVTYSMIICMNYAIPVSLHDFLGWVMIVFTVLNILANFAIATFKLFPEIL